MMTLVLKLGHNMTAKVREEKNENQNDWPLRDAKQLQRDTKWLRSKTTTGMKVITEKQNDHKETEQPQRVRISSQWVYV